MRLKEVQILNYRSCIKTKLDLQENLTTLIGVNGVGKSNILNSLQLIKSTKFRHYFSDHPKDDLSHTRLNLKIEMGSKTILFCADIYIETDERNIDEVHFLEMKFRFDRGKSRRWTKINPRLQSYINQKIRFGRTDLQYFSRFPSEINKISIKLLLYLSNVNYYSATQFSDPTRCPVSIELDDFRLSRQFRGNRNHELFIYDLYRTFKSNPKTFNLFVNTVNQKGIQLIDDLTFFDHDIPSSSYKVKAGGKIQKIEKPKKIIIPSVVVDGLSLSPNQLSEGTFKSLALVFYILNDDSNLLLIEEPEVCVHHGLLNSIIELIKLQSRKKQIIISTHSDYLLDKLSPENIILIKKDKIVGTKAKTLTKAMSKNDYQALKEYLSESGNLGEYWKEGGLED
ncbi:MAG: AAA family ATPase [Bacteroidetes bacterium]|nr:AAA family ATPase [Bacteroidota bacterium]